MRKPLLAGLAALSIIAASLPAQAQVPGQAYQGSQANFLDRLSSECKKGMMWGAIAGGALGGITAKKKNKLENAALGALAGAAAGCFISKQLNAGEKKRLTELERQAVMTNQTVSDQWTQANGQIVYATASPMMASAVPSPYGAPTSQQTCRRADVTIRMDPNPEQKLSGDVFCQSADGQWLIANG